jgi:hypothetical protein
MGVVRMDHFGHDFSVGRWCLVSACQLHHVSFLMCGQPFSIKRRLGVMPKQSLGDASWVLCEWNILVTILASEDGVWQVHVNFIMCPS